MMLEKSADSPIKGRRGLGASEARFSHFSHRYSAKLADANVFHTRFNTDAGLAAVSFFDGSLQIISTMLGDQMFQIQDEDMYYPITSLTWRPAVDDSMESQRLLGACLNGSIVRWDQSKGNSVEHIMLNQANKFHAIDYAGDRRRFVVAGSQPYIEIYDEERMTRTQQIGDRIDPAHTNKIFTCRFNPNAPNQLISGGWDRQVRFWDVRANRLSASIGGKTSISGDGVDISTDCNLVVTGGGTLGEGVKLWDVRGDLDTPVCEFVWGKAPNGDIVNPIVNCVRFVPRQNDLILAGVSDDRVSAKCLNARTGETVEEFTRVQGNCFSLDVCTDGALCGFGDSEGTLHFSNVNYTN